jgi:hypothetical protein
MRGTTNPLTWGARVSKDDAPPPLEIPTKRRQLRAVPDYWLAVWASRENLTTAERRRVEGEREHRKRLRNESDVIVGVCIGREGITPQQFDYIAGYLTGMQPAGVVHAGAPAKLVRAIGDLDIATETDFREVVQAAHVVLAAVKEPTEPVQKSGVWGAVKYARHRRTPVRIVLPNGTEG